MNYQIRLLLVTLILFGMTTTAYATEDLGNGGCRQEDGQLGVWNGTTADDDGCVTPAEYEIIFSAESLMEAGVIEGYTTHEDGTTTLHFSEGVSNTVATNPLDRLVAVNPELEPDAPTVGEWFLQPYGPR